MEAARHPHATVVGESTFADVAVTEQRLRRFRCGAAKTVPSGQNSTRLRPVSEGHRHKETVDAGLTGRAVVPVEDPVVAILTGQGLADRIRWT